MIARLSGLVVEMDAGKRRVVIECAGVGYEVTCTRPAYELADKMRGFNQPCSLRIYSHSREGDVTLYGFAEPFERRVFDLLQEPKGVGPGKAVALLSGDLDALGLCQAIAAGNVDLLTDIKGCGDKLAEMLVAELATKARAIADKQAHAQQGLAV